MHLVENITTAGVDIISDPAIVMNLSPIWCPEENIVEIDPLADMSDLIYVVAVNGVDEAVVDNSEHPILQPDHNNLNIVQNNDIVANDLNAEEQQLSDAIHQHENNNLTAEEQQLSDAIIEDDPFNESDAGSRGESPKPRHRQPKEWKRAKANTANVNGKKHISLKGKEKKSRADITVSCGPTCKRKCTTKVSMEQRKVINAAFWSVGNSSRQWDFISRVVTATPVGRRTNAIEDAVNFYRKFSYSYHFLVNGVKVQVCQTMFLKTLNISAMRVRIAMKKMMNRDGVISPDKRGKLRKKSRLHPSVRASVINHVNLFPTYESHYTRRRSKKRYLDEKLNVRKMHRNYKAGRTNDMPHTATQRQYEDIFRKEFKHKLGFYKPKKDQCGACLSWKNRPDHQKTEDARLSHEKHLANKAEARAVKDSDIALGEANEKVCVATFDLQKVFFCPHGENSEFIFKRKLRCYNLSFFQSVKKKGYCYVWDETIGKKGANEISSCAQKFIETKVNEGYTEFYFFSDNCVPQNKNSMLFSMYNVLSCKYGIKIVHTYLEKGHTQMECDSIHAFIERRCSKQTLCTPSAFFGVIRTAKVKPPFYELVKMTQTDIFDFKEVA